MSDDQKKQIEMMYDQSRSSFAGISEVDVDEMLQMQAERNALVLDVRTAAEQAVSMIPGAVTVTDFESNRDNYQDQPIVCYCTIGPPQWALHPAAPGRRSRRLQS